MEQIIDFSFFNKNGFINMLNAINLNSDIKEVNYSVNFEWFNLDDANKLSTLEFEQLNIYTELFGVVNFQLIEENLPRIFLLNSNFSSKDKFINLVNTYALNDICYGKIGEKIDEILQNIETPDSWRRKKRQLPNYVSLFSNPIYTNEREKELISIESLPGHSHQMNYSEKLWFGSSWQMYYSPVYYKYIPKFLFDNFKDCYENQVFENGLRKITLYENPEDYDLPENRARQLAFRRQVGIDSIAHELTKQNNRIEPVNLPVLITKENCKIGQTKVTRFLDNNGNLINSNLASKIEITEFLDDGITKVFEEIILLPLV